MIISLKKSINLNEKVKIFCPAAAFKHKALHIIPNIAKEIKDLSKILKGGFKKTSLNQIHRLKVLDKRGDKKYLEISLNKTNKNSNIIFNWIKY